MQLPGLITGNLEGDLAIVVLVIALLLLLRMLDKKMNSTQRLGAFSVGIGLLSVALAFFIDSQRTALPYANAPIDYERAGIGQTLYMQNCMHCHGLDGRGGGTATDMPTADLAVHILQHNEQYLYDVIANGKGTMPGVGDRLLTSQIGDVIHYVRSLAKKK